MKLLVILLCVLSERFLVHNASHTRGDLLSFYTQRLLPLIKKWSPWLQLLVLVVTLPVVALCILYFVDAWVLGFVGFLFNVLVLYSCIGPENPFYPVHSDNDPNGDYFARTNQQLFAVLFFYVFLGVFGALLYRITTYLKHEGVLVPQSTLLSDLLEWVPSRVTALTYLFVGNFQAGVFDYASMFFSPPVFNDNLLRKVGLQTVRTSEQKGIELVDAERQVDYALIFQLLLLAVFTIVTLI